MREALIDISDIEIYEVVEGIVVAAGVIIILTYTALMLLLAVVLGVIVLDVLAQ